MNLLFLTFSTLSSNAGHLARLSVELSHLVKLNKIGIACLGKYPEDEKNKRKYKNISFFHSPVSFNGWEINNLSETVENINIIISKTKPDVVILQMEVWDLMRELGRSLKGKVSFATVVHAMPFLGSPINPSGDFYKDVVDYANSGIATHRRDYIISRYKEIEDVFRNVSIIANNKTVEFFLHKYFKDLPILTLPSSLVVNRNKVCKVSTVIKYDLAFMARMEKGKGIEYLEEILKKISSILSRPVKIAIMGRTDDVFSKNALENLLLHAHKSKYFKVKYLGWIDDVTKEAILPYCGVFVYPSYRDNYPTVLIEALNYGLPCVTWKVPFSQLNYSGTSAVKCVLPFDFQKFAEVTVESLNNRSKLSIEAFKFIDSFDSLDKVAELDTELYKRISLRKNE